MGRPPMTGRVDVHHHWLPEAYVKALHDAGGDPSGWTVPKWNIHDDKKFSSRIGVSKVIFSITAPGAEIANDGPASIVKLARKMNEEAAQLRDSSPDEYGFFASLPSLLQEEDAINEIVYCLDVLKADGVTLFTRYGSDNHYLGHPNFARIWATLNERSAVVFVHPTHAVDTNLVNSHLPQPMIDYPHETTRTAIDLVMSKTVRNNPKCKIILSHAGGTLPYLALRPAMMLPHTPFQVGMTPETFLEDARSFYFDLALSGTRYQLGALLDFAKPGHILFGSDYPYAPSAAIEQMNRGLDDFTWSSEGKELYHAMQANALRLFPRLAKSSLSVPTANKSGKVALTNAYFRSIIVWFAVSSLLCLLSLRMAPLYWSRF